VIVRVNYHVIPGRQISMHIGFDERPRWVIEWITSPRFFVSALRNIMPKGSVVYLESYKARTEFLPFVQAYRCSAESRETVFEGCSDPRPTWTEHLTFGDDLINAFEYFFARWNFSYAEHVHGYHAGQLIFWFHDAFTGGDMHICSEVDANQVEAFCADLAPKARLEMNPDNDWHSTNPP
jgi:hypothetical protein